MIAIDQDPAGLQARLVSSAGTSQVWVKPLHDGSRAVALLNRASYTQRISTSFGAIGLPRARVYVVRDLWTGRAARLRPRAGLSARVGPGATVLLRVFGR